MKAKTQYNIDHKLREAVMTQLDWEPEAPGAGIGVIVSEGVVTLAGFVNTYSEKLAAEKVVKLVRGVRGVANDLVVRPFSQPTDTDIVKTALHTLESDVRVPADKVIVTVNEGIVTLEGEVEWPHQRGAAEAALEHLLGVRGILNEITVKPAIPPAEIKEKIAAALGRSALFGGDPIVVEAADGKVTLSGHVSSMIEREEAERIARAAPGAARVDNRLIVTP
ncbi:MAG TPA: BON domain-containing protein [Blastocatellia bacterium]|jgi:osmotically-inducible protein OsmY